MRENDNSMNDKCRLISELWTWEKGSEERGHRDSVNDKCGLISELWTGKKGSEVRGHRDSVNDKYGLISELWTGEESQKWEGIEIQGKTSVDSFQSNGQKKISLK